MYEDGYKIRNQSAIHFVSFAVVEWIDVFTRKDYIDIILDSLRFCQSNKGLVLHAYCIMSNHIHLIIEAKAGNLSSLLGDFKRFTSKAIVKAIRENKQESRREWMLSIFESHGQSNCRNKIHQFWRQDNRPMELYSTAFIFQKMNYIHYNPVEAGIVDKPEYYNFSSAKDYESRTKCGLLDVTFI